MNKELIYFIISISALLLFTGCNSHDNDHPAYGENGLPKNCRAIVKANINGYENGEFSAHDALEGINRNCGEFGYAWENNAPQNPPPEIKYPTIYHRGI